MTAHELYMIWKEANEMQNVGVDEWPDLEDNDIDVWVLFSELVSERMSKESSNERASEGTGTDGSR